MILVTGGAGFIGANFVHEWLVHGGGEPIQVIDKLTYAGNLDNIGALLARADVTFAQADICDRAAVERLLAAGQPRAVIHFAAESHVDHSIHGPGDFVRTNVNGTFEVLEALRGYWCRLDGAARDAFRYVHVSTDEVFGSLGASDPPFTETTRYAPNNPYAATKAASDHLVRAYRHTYGLPTLTANCSNNFGPYQFPEKLIPRVILNALDGAEVPVYGDGRHVRDWLFVTDHCAAIRAVLAGGRLGETYNIGARNEQSNIDVVRVVCRILDGLKPRPGSRYEDLIRFVADRPGHDRRYAVDPSKIERELDWHPGVAFECGLRRTVQWYLDHGDWVARVRDGRSGESQAQRDPRGSACIPAAAPAGSGSP